MLQEVNGAIQEITTTSYSVNNCSLPNTQPFYWNNYPVYICLDKTKKAIDILKTLEKEKAIKIQDVPRFIELVEKISDLL